MLLDFALPPRCPACGLVVGEPGRFCLDCWSALDFLGFPACDRCFLPLPFAAGDEELCAACLAEPPPFDRLRAAVAYGEVARKVALKLKYSGRPGVAEMLARLMLRHFPHGREPLLVPVPLHRWRLWKRGYNQAGLIAAALARRTGSPLAPDLLRRVKATPPLRGMNRRQRAETVRGAFRLAPGAKERIDGRDLLLVDDVFTTGSTLAGCARLLRRARAGRVDALVWARVVRGAAY